VGMLAYVKRIAKRVLPERFVVSVRAAVSCHRAKKTRDVFEHTPDALAWCSPHLLEQLQQEYSPPHVGYTLTETAQMAATRANELSAYLRHFAQVNTVLELGCGDGMVSRALALSGLRATAVDICTNAFDRRALQAGVQMLQMDASALKFGDASFDCVFSYNCFEHFLDPTSALKEASRVTRPGGHVYLFFAPLYGSARGLHAYRVITVPYCQFLWTRSALEKFAAAKNLGRIGFEFVNRWLLSDYRLLWKQYEINLQKELYYEFYDTSHLTLIRRYPECFRGKVREFDDLVVSGIKVLFRRVC